MGERGGETSQLSALVLAPADLISSLPRDAFETYQCRVSYTQTIDQAQKTYDQQAPDTVFLPLMIGPDSTLSLIGHVLQHDPTVPIIIIAQNDQINDAAEAMRRGAYDCIFVPFSKTRLEKTIGGICEKLASRSRRITRAPPVKTQGKIPATTQGKTPKGQSTTPKSDDHTTWDWSQLRAPRADLGDLPLEPLLRAINTVSSNRAPVFIWGERGTGKHVLARALHSQSNRASAPFIALDCANLTSERLAQQVLAQSGRIIDKVTVLLQNIANMPGALQSRMIRFVDTGDLSIIGGHRRLKLNIRVISTSTTDPEADIRAGRLNKDLFRRLHTVPIHLPPLRQSGQGLMAVAHAKLHALSAQQNRQFRGFSDEARAAICAYGWPGNIRQLAQVIEQIVLTNDAPQVGIDMLPGALLDQTSATSPAYSPPHNAPEPRDDDLSRSGLLGRSLADIERIVIEETIRAQNGSLPKAARILGVAPSTIYRKREGWKNT